MSAIGTEISGRHGAAAVAAAIDEVVSDVLGIVNQIAAFEAELAKPPPSIQRR
jgi:hypothetical protein